MQIDFHHTVTYVAARGAGFNHDEADTIATAAQYVDDAVHHGAICFDNKAMYHRICSAHKSLDLKNLDDIENHLVWLPFHFLPGNGGKEAGQDPQGSFIQKIICRPDSPVARDMLAAINTCQSKPNCLHRLGVTMHVYADTWAHQGFAGVLHEVNEVEDAKEHSGSAVFNSELQHFLIHTVEDAAPPLGHGRAYVLPDMPFLDWSYENGQGDNIRRNNTDLFCAAAEAMCKAMQEYRRVSDPTVAVSGLPDHDQQQIRTLFINTKLASGEERHKIWLTALKEGRFSFGPVTLSYHDSGKHSWKAKALGAGYERPVHSYQPSFLQSDWKYFHDAIQEHRLVMLHDILPRYGICAG